MILLSILSFFSFYIHLVHGDVSISQPLKGDSYTVSGGYATVPISWIESNSDPLLTDIESYAFTICTGPNSDIQGLETIDKITASSISDNAYDLKVPSTVGADGPYFIQIYATAKEGGYSIHYSYRFNLEGMTGSVKASGTDASPPNAEVNLETTTQATEVGDISKSFKIFYTSQTGKTRYAPMQTQPGTTVTASSWSRRFPTSAVSYYSTIRATPDQLSTVTPGWDYSITSAVNWASIALDPTDNGGWYNPASRLQSSLSKLQITTA